MFSKRLAASAVFLAAGALTLGACASTPAAPPVTPAATQPALASVQFVNGTAKANNAAADTGDLYPGASTDPVATKWVQLTSGSAGTLNPVVVNGAGFTLYRFDKDTAKPPKSNCDGDCAKTWPPVLVQPGGKVFLDGMQSSDVGTVQRTDGTLQVTVGGWPVYRFSKDTAAGQTNGQGVGGTWFGVAPDGTKAAQPSQGTNDATGLDYQTGTAAQHNAAPNTGDFFNGPSNDPAAMKWVQLTSGSANGLNPIVHNGVGFTFYRFDKDTAKPPKSNCDGDCAKTWPPVLVQPGSRIFVNGVPTAKVGIVTRSDGTRQVTIGGWPIYRFSKDTAPGQTNGEGVGGTWFAISPTGGKITPPAGSTGTTTAAPPTTTAASPTSTTLGNGTVTLFDDVGFADNGSQQLAGPGCKNVVRAAVASSLKLDGGPVKIWSGINCTGSSHIVASDIADLSTVGFDNLVTSVKFGS
jgi:predicted lipoprotein with Yx(FWY)xxD motif